MEMCSFQSIFIIASVWVISGRRDFGISRKQNTSPTVETARRPQATGLCRMNHSISLSSQRRIGSSKLIFSKSGLGRKPSEPLNHQ